MKPEYEQFLKVIAEESGMDLSMAPKKAFLNPLANNMFANLIESALKGLEAVSIATFDFKLVAIVKLLQSWVKEQREAIEKQRVQTTYGADAWKSNPYGNY
jgi:hypothetical protein